MTKNGIERGERPSRPLAGETGPLFATEGEWGPLLAPPGHVHSDFAMEISGNIPFHVARAYGAAAARMPAHSAPISSAHSAQNASQSYAIGQTDSVTREPISASAVVAGPPSMTDVTEVGSRGVSRPRLIDRIVAGTVDRPISFDGAATLPGPAGGGDALPLYTRAADKVEAATGVFLGRAVDITG